MKLLFIRHGQTDFNKNKIPQGQEIDAPLNDTGIGQAEEAAQSLPEGIDLIISSPLRRTRETAEILNKKLNKEIEFNDDVKEFSYGSLAGKPWSEIEVITGDKDAHKKDDDITFDYRAFGGESAEDLKRRVAKFVDDMKAKYPEKCILIATHAGVIDSMHILFPQEERAATNNAAVHEFRF